MGVGPAAGLSRVLMTLVPLVFSASCQPQEDNPVSESLGWRGRSAQVGDTLIVRTTGGSVWQGEGRLVEEVAIGTEARGENDMLASVGGIDAHDGLVYIGDDMLRTIRVYDMAGRHVADIGRSGEGPGEFSGGISDVGIDPARDHLLVRQRVGVIHRLTLTGEFVNRSPMRFNYSFNRTGLDMRVTREGRALIPQYYAKIKPGGDPWFVRRFFLYTFDPSGAAIDSLELPMPDEQPYVLKAYANPGTFRPAEVPFFPRYLWTVGWDGSFISGTGDQYRFEIRYPDRRSTIIERETEAIPVLPEERSSQIRRVQEILRDVDPRWEWDGPEIPEVKGWYTDLIPDRSGRIWVLREGEGHRVEGWTEPEDWRGWTHDPEWVSELWFDVFDEASGRYLGRVDAPEAFMRDPEPLIDGDMFICLTEDGMGRPVVRRYRLVLPPS